MKRQLFVLISSILILGSILGLVSCYKHRRTCDGYGMPSYKTNSLEDQYVIKELEYDIAAYGEDPIIKPIVSGFNNINKQKTLNVRLNFINKMTSMNNETGRNEQLYNVFEIHQRNYYIFSCQYFTTFETTISNKGVNMLVGSEINGTLLMNLLALLGSDLILMYGTILWPCSMKPG